MAYSQNVPQNRSNLKTFPCQKCNEYHPSQFENVLLCWHISQRVSIPLGLSYFAVISMTHPGHFESRVPPHDGDLSLDGTSWRIEYISINFNMLLSTKILDKSVNASHQIKNGEMQQNLNGKIQQYRICPVKDPNKKSFKHRYILIYTLVVLLHCSSRLRSSSSWLIQITILAIHNLITVTNSAVFEFDKCKIKAFDNALRGQFCSH